MLRLDREIYNKIIFYLGYVTKNKYMFAVFSLLILMYCMFFLVSNNEAKSPYIFFLI